MMIGHIVLFQPKPDLSADAISRFIGALSRGFKEIPGIRWARVGKRLQLGVAYAQELGHIPYSHAAILEFDDRESFVRYLEHPAHAEIGRQFWETCAATMILDVETVNPLVESLDTLLVE
jgi:hypothetical protein